MTAATRRWARRMEACRGRRTVLRVESRRRIALCDNCDSRFVAEDAPRVRAARSSRGSVFGRVGVVSAVRRSV